MRTFRKLFGVCINGKNRMWSKSVCAQSPYSLQDSIWPVALEDRTRSSETWFMLILQRRKLGIGEIKVWHYRSIFTSISWGTRHGFWGRQHQILQRVPWCLPGSPVALYKGICHVVDGLERCHLTLGMLGSPPVVRQIKVSPLQKSTGIFAFPSPFTTW